MAPLFGIFSAITAPTCLGPCSRLDKPRDSQLDHKFIFMGVFHVDDNNYSIEVPKDWGFPSGPDLSLTKNGRKLALSTWSGKNC